MVRVFHLFNDIVGAYTYLSSVAFNVAFNTRCASGAVDYVPDWFYRTAVGGLLLADANLLNLHGSRGRAATYIDSGSIKYLCAGQSRAGFGERPRARLICRRLHA